MSEEQKIYIFLQIFILVTTRNFLFLALVLTCDLLPSEFQIPASAPTIPIQQICPWGYSANQMAAQNSNVGKAEGPVLISSFHSPAWVPIASSQLRKKVIFRPKHTAATNHVSTGVLLYSCTQIMHLSSALGYREHALKIELEHIFHAPVVLTANWEKLAFETINFTTLWWSIHAIFIIDMHSLLLK